MQHTPLKLVVVFLSSAAGTHAAEIIRANNNASALNTSGAWVGGTVPAGGDSILWNSTFALPVAIASTPQMGADLNLSGIRVTNAGGTRNATTLTGFQSTGTANTLTLGTGGVDMSTALQALGMQAKVTLTGSQTWNVPNVNTANNVAGMTVNEDLTFLSALSATNGVVSPFDLGGGTVTKTGAGTVAISSGYTISNGQFAVNAGTLHIQSGASKITTLEPSLALTVNTGGTLNLAVQSAAMNVNAPITLNTGSTLGFIPAQGNPLTLSATAPIMVAGNATINFQRQNVTSGNQNAGAIVRVDSSISGPGNVTYSNTVSIANKLRLNGDNSAYAGTWTLAGTTGDRSLRLENASSGSAAATWVVNAGNILEADGVEVQLGTLNGAGTVTNSHASNPAGIIVGAGSFSGAITDGAAGMSLTKIGTGTLTLSGLNTYAGNTTVNQGTLLVTAAQTGSTAVTVADGAGYGVSVETAGTTLSIPSLTTGAGSVIHVSTGLTGNPAAAPLNAGIMSIPAAAIVRVSGTGFTPASGIPLIAYSTLGSADFSRLSLELPPRILGNLVNNTGASRIDLDITGVDRPRWNGNVSTDWDADDGTGTGTLNWRTVSGGAATRYIQTATSSDSALFDDTAAAGTVNLTTALRPTGITVDNAVRNYVFSGPGRITGTGGLEKKGTGTLQISNAAANDYSGTTTILAGKLVLGDGTTPGAGTLGTGPVINDGTLVLNRPDDFSLAATSLTGTGTLSKEAAGTASLTGAAAIPNIEVNSGVLRFEAGGTITGLLSGTGGQLRNAAGTLTIAGNAANTFSGLLVSAGGILALNQTGGNATGGNIEITGTGQMQLPQLDQIPDTATVTLTGSSTDSITTQAGPEVVANVVVNSSVGGAAGGQLIMRSGFTVTGTGTVNSGILAVASSNTASVGGVVLTCPPGSSGILRIAGSGGPSSLDIGSGGITASGGEIQVKFNTNAQDAQINLSGNLTATGNLEITNAGFTGANLNVINLLTDSQWNIAAGTTTTVAPDLGGTGSLTKTGAGTLVLRASCATTCPGNTRVLGGVLNLQGTITGSDVTVTGATLSGTGTITAATTGVDVNAGGILAPGNGGAGTLTVNAGTGKLDLVDAVAPAASGALAFDIGTAASDQILITGGSLDIGTGVLGIDDLAITAAPGLTAGTFTLIDAGTAIIGSLAPNVTGPVGSFTGTLSLEDGGTKLVLTLSSGTTPLQAWRQTHFGTTTSSGSAANDADPDGDGVPNLAEYLFGTIPTDRSSSQFLAPAQAGATVSATYTRAKAAVADLTITGQVSTDLSAWSAAGVTETILTDDGTTQSVRISAPAAGNRQFLRLRLQEK